MLYLSKAEDPALSHISFTSKPGRSPQIIGSTGAESRPFLNLILRLYDVSEGKILVDGVDVRDYKQQELRSKIGYVPRRTVLFSGTVSDNIRIGRRERERKGD
jgi:ATP-binding cassette subfamily B protein